MEITKEVVEKAKTTKELLFITRGMLKVDEQSFDSISFVSNLIFVFDRLLTGIIAGLIQKGITKKLRNPKIIEFIIYELTLNSKVKILKEINDSPERRKKYAKLFGYLENINGIRNKIFHSKLEGLTYKEGSINDVEVQKLMILDFIEASDQALSFSSN